MAQRCFKIAEILTSVTYALCFSFTSNSKFTPILANIIVCKHKVIYELTLCHFDWQLIQLSLWDQLGHIHQDHPYTSTSLEVIVFTSSVFLTPHTFVIVMSYMLYITYNTYIIYNIYMLYIHIFYTCMFDLYAPV